jgi:ElaB/YqjD/DUF883 family membrane-anchored ribosome-binding protein
MYKKRGEVMRGVKLDRLGETLQERTSELRESATAVIEDVREKAEDVARRAQRKSEDLADDARSEIKRHPLTAVGISVAAGALIGATIGLLIGYNSRHKD